uniref:Uncharacterized protein n=1 Tax=Haptolina brevifila TaxID=156173 RepID=A0A7S2NIU7_9EUKA|eukprot:CAMPEP_0174720788 /NCGR_PEP_ID=MMETSP1094-20130205/34484_1 /TAXON_ID=156173 /ORGANISM="Chrysochromulina brevifilum, Strain UTEX LB 985" /LENGTH=258 /DNA_ID=CAMNT_0015921343 /DNA_START=38 /DNA_END=814 /DNA_ORIENTATION=+
MATTPKAESPPSERRRPKAMAARRKAAKQQLQQVSEDGPLPQGAPEATDALVMAAMQGNEEAIDMLIGSGEMLVNQKDSIGVAPLHWAAFCGHPSVCTRLLDAKADIHVRDREGRTPLHVAAYENQESCLRTLIEAGADLHSPDKVGWTPLHCAVSNSIERACSLLTDAGAEVQRKDTEGKSSMDLAIHFGNSDVLRILERAQEQRELLALKGMGIGSHRPQPSTPTPTTMSASPEANAATDPPADSPISLSSPIAVS